MITEAKILHWTPGNKPNVRDGGLDHFIVVVESPNTRTRYTMTLDYLNRFPMSAGGEHYDVPESCERPDGGEPDDDDSDWLWTGWFQEHCSHCEMTWKFDRPERIIAHMPLPKYP